MSTTSPAPISDGEIDDAYIGRRVHQLMWDQHISQTALAPQLGMDQSTLGKRLRGTVGWPGPLLVKVAKVLGTTVAYLVGESDDPVPPTPAVDTRLGGNDRTLDYRGDDSTHEGELIRLDERRARRTEHSA